MKSLVNIAPTRFSIFLNKKKTYFIVLLCLTTSVNLYKKEPRTSYGVPDYSPWLQQFSFSHSLLALSLPIPHLEENGLLKAMEESELPLEYMSARSANMEV